MGRQVRGPDLFRLGRGPGEWVPIGRAAASSKTYRIGSPLASSTGSPRASFWTVATIPSGICSPTLVATSPRWRSSSAVAYEKARNSQLLVQRDAVDRRRRERGMVLAVGEELGRVGKGSSQTCLHRLLSLRLGGTGRCWRGRPTSCSRAGAPRSTPPPPSGRGPTPGPSPRSGPRPGRRGRCGHSGFTTCVHDTASFEATRTLIPFQGEAGASGLSTTSKRTHWRRRGTTN